MSVMEAQLLGAVWALWAMLIVWMVVVTVRSLIKRPRADAPPVNNAEAPLLPGKSPTWHAVPGGRIELGGSGFAIALVTEANRAWYTLFSPEGHILAHLNDLAVLKQCAERFAAEREEFIYISVPPQNKAQA
jgi:hypothetical protein